MCECVLERERERVCVCVYCVEKSERVYIFMCACVNATRKVARCFQNKEIEEKELI